MLPQLALVIVCAAAVFGVPLPTAVDLSIFKDLQCVAQCEARFWTGPGKAMVDFGKAVQWGSVLGQLESTCVALKQAFNCAELCNPKLNPFKRELIDVTCDKEKLAELKPHKQCFLEQSARVDDICQGACSVFADDLVTAMATENKLEQFGSKCGVSKCNARCSRSAFSDLCQAAAGDAMKTYAEYILASFNKGWSEQQMETALPAYPPQCHFFFFGQQFFGGPEPIRSIAVAPSSSKEHSS